MWCVKAVGIVALLIAVPAAALEVVGEPQTVFSGGPGLCGGTVVPDAPARAWREADGSVRLMASYHIDRLFKGPDLDHLALACDVVYRGAESHDPAAYNDHDWLAAPYTTDGRTVYALIHDEFHGHLRPDLCPAAQYLACWANRVTAAISRDGGENFQRLGLVATPPYRYDGTVGHQVGYFTPSNIIERDGWFYATLFATAWRDQPAGNCLMRTRDLADPGAWRAWDGHDFTVRFVDPYRETVADPAAHVCAPLPALRAPVSGIVRQRGSGQYLATMAATGGVFVSTSPDLLAWTPPRLVWAATVMGQQGCDHPWALGYPVLLDPAAPGRNFDTVGDEAWLYFSRLWVESCRLTMRRDLVRVRVRL
jgi:hypothetical protein